VASAAGQFDAASALLGAAAALLAVALAGAAAAFGWRTRRMRRRKAGDRLSLDPEGLARSQRQLQRQAHELTLAYERFDASLRDSPISVTWQDASLRYEWVFNLPPGAAREAFLGRTDKETIPEAAANAIIPVKEAALVTGEPQRLELPVMRNGQTRWYDMRVQARRDGATIVGLTTLSVDITERKAAEQQLRLLMRELSHRSKNLLAVIQAVARQTAASSPSVETFVERFSARLKALADAHDLLVHHSWHSASLEDLVRTQLAVHAELIGNRITVSGEALLLNPEAAQHFALALHELATNAAKYGALSSPTGTVAIAWSQQSTAPDGTARVTFVWRERGGPPVSPPSSRGFGRVMIERIVPRALDGEADLAFEPEGLVWTLSIPLASVGKAAD
jgi:two-component sensor histidine kinase